MQDAHRTTCSTAVTIGTARFPAKSTAVLNASATPSAPPGLRMAYEIYLQLLGRAGERQLRGRSGNGPAIGLTHNLGGIPNRNIASVSILGLLSA